MVFARTPMLAGWLSRVSRCTSRSIQSTTVPSLPSSLLRQTRTFTTFNTPPPPPPPSSSGSDHHAFFQQQLEELEQERTSFFRNENNSTTTGVTSDTDKGHGNDNGNGNGNDNGNDNDNDVDLMAQGNGMFRDSPTISATDANHDHGELDVDVEDMNAEREALFEFSAKEKQAWGSSGGGTHAILPSQLLDDIRKARSAQEEQEEDPSSSSHLSSSQPTPASAPDLALTKERAPPQSSDPHPNPHPHHDSFSHVSADGASIHMVDVGHKRVTTRMAQAQAKVLLPPEVLEAFDLSSSSNSQDELVGPKGPIFATAKLAGIMAAKKTSDMIPLCHPLPLDQVRVDIRLQHPNEVVIDCTCRVTHKTGVEMEALMGASVAALTIYDMVKAVSHAVEITSTKLISKTGGKRTVLEGKTQ